MRLKSAFTDFFHTRLVGFGIAVAVLVIFFTASSFRKDPDPNLRAKQVNLLIRQIGHRLLLQAGDSTSRVMPVSQVKEGTFLLQFENEFVFSHDSLMVLSQSLLRKTQFPSGYTVTVHDCSKDDIVYGFQLNNTSPDILACNGRTQPAGCYTIEFTFPDFYGNSKQKITDISSLTKPVKDSRQPNLKPGEFKTTSFDQNMNQLTGSAQVDAKEVNPKSGESKKNSFPLGNVIFGGMLILLCLTFLVGRFGKNLRTIPVQNQNQTEITASISDLPALGKFLFDAKVQRLLIGNEVITLTDKESKVLELLHKNFGELIPRDTLMQEVWINEGVITGRSLDMFISKLRKKLSADAELRITNVHGKGYRLEVVNDVIA